jgi:hypothetical protein
MKLTTGYCLKWFLYWLGTGKAHPDHLKAALNDIRQQKHAIL